MNKSNNGMKSLTKRETPLMVCQDASRKDSGVYDYLCVLGRLGTINPPIPDKAVIVGYRVLGSFRKQSEVDGDPGKELITIYWHCVLRLHVLDVR